MNKYRNIKTVVDGKTFDSRREAHRYGVLKLLEKQGHIKNLRCQVTYRLEVGGLLICKYVADFVYEMEGKEQVEDSKGFHTPVFRMKQKLMKAVHGIEIKIS